MRLLVTGAGGFVGSVLCKEFERLGYSVVGLENFSHGSSQALEGFGGKVVKKDLRLFSESDLEGIDAVFHQGAISDPTNPDEKAIMEVNYESSVRLISACSKKGIRCAYASSSAVYGNAPAPNVEFSGEAPFNAYGRSKLQTDMFALKLIERGEKLFGLRYFNIYGPGEGHKGKGTSIVYYFLKPMLEGKSPLVFGDGAQRRDLVYIKDVVRANLLALEAEKGCIVNVGSGKSVEYNELVALMNRLLGTVIAPVYQKNPLAGKYQFLTMASLASAGEKLGFVPKYGIEDGVREYIDYFKAGNI